MRTILVSPHSDDIALSLGGTLLQNFFHEPILMVTIFTKSSEIISKVRHLEDVDFANKLQIKFQSFNFSEPPLRGYSHRDIFANNNPVSDPVYTEVYHALSKLIKSYGCELIVSPMGIGNHIDHIITCNVCYKIAMENDIRIVFYEDLPYASRLTFKQIKVRANSISPDLQQWKINITPKFNGKIDNIKLYKTQTGRVMQIMIKSHALRLDIENKSLKELIVSYNLFKYLLFLFTNECVQIPLYERIWHIKTSGK